MFKGSSANILISLLLLVNAKKLPMNKLYTEFLLCKAQIVVPALDAFESDWCNTQTPGKSIFEILEA